MRATSDVAVFCDLQYPRLVGALTLYTGDRGVAEEFAQEALARAVRQWSTVRTMTAPGAWVHRVAINLANSHFRRRAAERRANARASARTDDSYSTPDTADAVAIRQAVAALPERMRTALVLRYYTDLSVEQVAEIMGITPGSVRVVTSRAVAHLREQLGRDAAFSEETSDVH